MEAKDFNILAENVKKVSATIQTDVLDKIKELTAKAEDIVTNQNPVESEFTFYVGKNIITGRLHRNGNIVILCTNQGVINEIKKRLSNNG